MIIDNLIKIKSLIEHSHLLIFDFDGVLADSAEIKAESFKELFKEYGEKVLEQIDVHNQNFGGKSRFEKISHYHQHFVGQKIDKNKINELANIFSHIVKDKVIASNEIPGAINFLNSNYLKKKCVINSATPEIEIIDIVNARFMSHFFLRVLGSPNSKLQNLNSLLKLYPSTFGKAIFFGDTESDLNAAVKAGIKFVGVGKTIKKNLMNSPGVHFHINDFESLINGS